MRIRSFFLIVILAAISTAASCPTKQDPKYTTPCSACDLYSNPVTAKVCRDAYCPKGSPTTSPTETKTPTTKPTGTAIPLSTTGSNTLPFWDISVRAVNGFGGCNPSNSGLVSNPCSGDLTDLFFVPGYDIVPQGTSCDTICAKDPGRNPDSSPRTYQDCWNNCFRNDNTNGMCCGGSCACDVDHLSCRRVEVACQGVNNDFIASLTISGANVNCQRDPSGFAFICSGSGAVQFCADVPSRPFVKTLAGRTIRTDRATINCKSGTFR